MALKLLPSIEFGRRLKHSHILAGGHNPHSPGFLLSGRRVEGE